jgi:hypothetical protein
MPTWSFAELVVLGFILVSFAAFGFTLLTVSLWVTLARPPAAKAAPRQVTPAIRVGAPVHS